MFLKNCWQVAGFPDELAQPVLARRLSDEGVIMFRTEDGSVTAMEDLCPHRLVPLSAGRRDGDEIVCGYHGMRFDAAGRCTAMPGRNQPRSSARLRRFPLVERWGILWIWLGEPTLADPALIPDFFWLGDGGWASVSGHMHFQADYRLLNDNLLDLSHESFVHPTSIGNGLDEVIAEFPATVSEDGRMVRCERVMRGIKPPPAYVDRYAAAKTIDRYQTAVYMAPGLNLTDAMTVPCDQETKTEFRQRTLHLLTPETERSTHYFFVTSRNHSLNDPERDEMSKRITYKVFGEDKAMLELQQATLDRMPDARLPRVAWALDEAPVKGRRMLEQLIADERADPGRVVPPGRFVAS
jgi:vanillate O-demethylase monooxygenase subunit